jgi:TRAP-type uncharacterized transport system fused permease subunit
MLELPRAGEVAVTGLHFLLPIVVLLWCILVERLSPALSAFWATLAMIFVVLTPAPPQISHSRHGPTSPLTSGAASWISGTA